MELNERWKHALQCVWIVGVVEVKVRDVEEGGIRGGMVLRGVIAAL